MEIFNKILTETDITVRLAFPSSCLNYLPDFEGNDFVDLKVKDSNQKLRVIRCKKRRQRHSKPVLSTGWLQYVEDYNLRVGDRVALLHEIDDGIGSEYKIEAWRKAILFGNEIWEHVPNSKA